MVGWSIIRSVNSHLNQRRTWDIEEIPVEGRVERTGSVVEHEEILEQRVCHLEKLKHKIITTFVQKMLDLAKYRVRVFSKVYQLN